MEFQVALCKLQLLAQKWSIKSNRNNISWHSALQLALTQINSTSHNNENQVSLISMISFDRKSAIEIRKKVKRTLEKVHICLFYKNVVLLFS
jgi:hypothetical protein